MLATMVLPVRVGATMILDDESVEGLMELHLTALDEDEAGV